MAKYYRHTDPNPPPGDHNEALSATSQEGRAAYMLLRHVSEKERPNFVDRSIEPHPFTGATERIANRMGLSGAYMGNQADSSDEVNRPLSHAIVAELDIDTHKSMLKGNISDESKPYSRKILRDAGIDYAKNYSQLQSAMESRQPTELFTGTSKKTVVEEAFADPSMRAAIPIMGAYAHQQHGTLTASSDLSEHSSRMVKHAKGLGLPIATSEANPDAERVNDLGFSPMFEERTHRFIGSSGLSKKEEISPDEVASAKKHYRTIRGIGRSGESQEIPKSLGPQFNQPKLPGMENF